MVQYVSDAKRRERVNVKIDGGLRGVSGPLGFEALVTTQVILEPGVGLRNISAQIQDIEEGRIFLDFTIRVDARVARDYIRVEPAVRHEVEPWNEGLCLRGKFEPGVLYRVRLRGGLPAEGGRFLPDDVVRSVRMPELAESISFLGEGRFLNRQGSLNVMVRTVNVDPIEVRIERIFTNNLVHFIHHSYVGYLGQEILESRRIPLNAVHNKPVFTRLDLRQLVGPDIRGPLRIHVRSSEDSWREASRIITVTDLGIHLKSSPKGLLAWVVRLADLKPVAQAAVTVLSQTNQEIFTGMTDAEGLVRFEDGPAGPAGQPFVVIAETATDFAYVSLADGVLSRAGLDVEGRPYLQTSCEAFVYPERGVIRPGEEIHLRALLRDAAGAIPAAGMPLAWEVLRPDGRTAATGPVVLGDLGTIEWAWTSANYLPTGRYAARLRVPGDKGPVLGDASFRVEEFMPETLRTALTAEEKRFAGGTSLPVKVRAEHLFGGAAAGLQARGRCELRPLEFTHPAWPGVAFTSSTGEQKETTILLEPVALNEKGEADLAFELPANLKARSALQAAVTVSVLEVSGRASTARIVRAVDPLPFYLGARQAEGQARIGQEWKVDLIAIRPDGTAVDIPEAKGRVVRVTWSHSLKRDQHSGYYRWASEKLETEIATRTVALPGGLGSFGFSPEVGGEYKIIVASARGPGEVPVETSISFRTAGGDPEGGSLEIPSRIALTADKAHYRAGETARLQVESPITGLALLCTETDRVHSARVLDLKEPRTVLEIPVTAELVPHGYVTLTVVRESMAPDSRGVPVRAFGAVALLRDPAERAAKVDLAVSGTVRPGDPIRIDVTVQRPDGSPEEAEVAVALVDAGILSLTAFQTPDPLKFFLAQRALGTQAVDIYSMIVPEPRDLLARASSEPGGDEDGAGLLNPISAHRVKSVSLWLGGLRTDAGGRVSREIPAPDFDGELVALAVVAGRSSVGSARRELKVRRPLILEPGLPRFLAPGDRFLAPVSLHNTTEAGMRASVTLGLKGPVRCQSGQAAEQTAEVGAGKSAVLWFALEAVDSGVAEVDFDCAVLDGAGVPGERFRKSVELSVRPAAPPVSIQGSLALDGGKSAIVEPARGFLEGTISSELVLDTSMLPDLEGSLRYLLHYPYGCVEQTTSSLIPWITLKDYLKSIDSVAYADDEIQDRVDAGIHRLFSMQTSDGGLGWWPGDSHSYTYGSLHAAWVLGEAKAAGYSLPEARYRQLLSFIDDLLVQPREEESRPAATVRAFALEILAREGRTVTGWIDNLYQRREEMSEEAMAHLAVAAVLSKHRLPEPLLDPDSVLSLRSGSGTGSAGSAMRVPAPADRDLTGLLYSRPRELCVILGALVDMGTPREKLLPILKALGGFKEGGRYRSTQEDGLFVFALGKVARLFQRAAGPVRVTIEAIAVPPAGLAQASDPLDRMAAGVVHAALSDPGAAAAVNAIAVNTTAMSAAAPERLVSFPRTFALQGRKAISLPAGTGPLRLSVEDGGTVFAFWETRGVPTGEAAQEDKGLVVRREFLGREGKPIGDNRFRQGDTVVVEIRLKSGRALQNVVIVDALPAGFEIENPELVNSDGKTAEQGHLNLRRSDLRDDRLILFANPAEGESRYSYVVRAVTVGTFALPPVSAECMYDSSIHSLHGAGTVEVVR